MASHPAFFLRCLLASTLLISGIAHGAEGYFDYYFRDPGLKNPQWVEAYQHILANIDQHDYKEADQAMSHLLDEIDSNDIQPIPHAKLLANAGVLKAATNHPSDALPLFEKSINLASVAKGQFDPLLFNPLMANGLALLSLNEYKKAMDSFRYAQHITHREDGVYTRKQLPVLDEITHIDLVAGSEIKADQELRFDLRINERAYGKHSESLIPTLEKLGTYFAHRANALPRNPEITCCSQYQRARLSTQVPDLTPSTINNYRMQLFMEALGNFNRAIKILEDKYGPNDLRLAEPLKGLANVRLRQGAYSAAEDTMERATKIVQDDPSSDVADKARALVELGDMYTVTSDNRASQCYEQAWGLLADAPNLKEVGQTLFAQPKRLYPPLSTWRLQLQPSNVDRGTPLYVDATFTVDADGTASNIEIKDANIPHSNVVRFQHFLKSVIKYRPRLADGKAVDTPGVTAHQTFVLEADLITNKTVKD